MDFQYQNTGTADCCIFRPPSGQNLTAAHLVIFCQHGRPCEPKKRGLKPLKGTAFPVVNGKSNVFP